FNNGQPVPAVCEEFKIAHSTLYNWIKQYSPIVSPKIVYSPAEFYNVARKLETAEHQLQIIALSKCIEDIPLQKRLELLTDLYEHKKQYSVHELCNALGVARGTFYNHIFRKADWTERIQKQEELMFQVQQIFDDSKQRYGAKKIRTVLTENGVRISFDRIRGIMQELGLKSIRCNSKQEFKKRQAYLKRNILNRDFTAEQPNQAWVSDITYFKIDNRPIYLCVIIDLFSRKVVGFKVSRNMSTQLVTATFRSAFSERGRPEGLLFHSDRGTQYTSRTFVQLLQECGAKQSFSNTGRPCDNAVAEAFFSTFKREEAYRKDYSSERDFSKSVEEYIHFYNNVRYHMTLAYKTPAQFEKLYIQRHNKDLVI
ncbi:MAG TPA: IS3 family transposase, partial [Pseudoflavonifractor sp.]|nr:IS3 family transposase [Pseudoflavonifractor sp.]